MNYSCNSFTELYTAKRCYSVVSAHKAQGPYLVNRYTIDVGVVDEPDDLVAEQLSVVLGGQVGLGGLAAVQLQSLPDTLAQHVQGRVGLHDLCHGLLDEWFGACSKGWVSGLRFEEEEWGG